MNEKEGLNCTISTYTTQPKPTVHHLLSLNHRENQQPQIFIIIFCIFLQSVPFNVYILSQSIVERTVK